MNELTAAWRGEFPGLEQSVYLNTCSPGQLSRRSIAAMHRYMELWQRYGAGAWYELWWAEPAGAFAAQAGT